METINAKLTRILSNFKSSPNSNLTVKTNVENTNKLPT